MMKFHEMMGHPNEGVLRNTATAYNWKLKSTFDNKCENCAITNRRQANIPKAHIDRSETKGERFMIEICSVKHKSAGGNKFWLMILDDATDFVWSMFLKSKSELSSKTIGFIKDRQAKVKDVKNIRCDRAGENW